MVRYAIGALVAVIALLGCSSGDGEGWVVPGVGDEQGNSGKNIIVIEEWGVEFALPDTISADDVTIAHHPTEPGEPENVAVSSAILAGKLITDLCGGTALKRGEFVSIYRSDRPDDDTVPIGDHHFRVYGSLADDMCYDAETSSTYLVDSVNETVQKTLTTS
ncbi:hypothetical protein CFN78_26050 [Amycolatopsis antarctica]|uniref:Lipoprotein n=1 Tax=Amycolatopsis antarctica TaxID=1854586 RepID=A0A263CW70_9PSEU|nr:hypothetical protein CFN78_26050 [Amycolatopsis antarctica]